MRFVLNLSRRPTRLQQGSPARIRARSPQRATLKVTQPMKLCGCLESWVGSWIPAVVCSQASSPGRDSYPQAQCSLLRTHGRKPYRPCMVLTAAPSLSLPRLKTHERIRTWRLRLARRLKLCATLNIGISIRRNP